MTDGNRQGRMPQWATIIFRDALDRITHLQQVLRLAQSGISMVTHGHNAVKVLHELDELEGTPEEREAALTLSARDRDLAQAEIESDFPLLHEQAVVALWGALEALVRTFAAAWLDRREGAWRSDSVRRLRVKIGDYEDLDPADRSLWVVDLLDQEAGGPLRAGVGRFESLLSGFGLSGDVEPDTRKVLFELSQVRNVIVHRQARADKRMVESCPWLGLAAGDSVRITHRMWATYSRAVDAYIAQLIKRVATCFGDPHDEPQVEGTAQLELAPDGPLRGPQVK